MPDHKGYDILILIAPSYPNVLQGELVPPFSCITRPMVKHADRYNHCQASQPEFNRQPWEKGSFVMTITNRQSGTNVHEVSDGIFRINTPVNIAGGFSFNQYLIVDDEPLLFHAGLRKMFPLIHEAVESIIPVKDLRYIAFAHFEADECGSLNEWLGKAPKASPVCSRVAAMVSIDDVADRAAIAMAEGDTLSLGKHTVRWLDAPHLPHGWDNGFLIEESTGTLLCGDLFTQGGVDLPAVTESDILEPSEAFRKSMDYFSHSTKATGLMEKLAREKPNTLACMHGSAWKGDGASLLRELGKRLFK